MLTDIGILCLLLLMNGFFAMAELALVSARRGRLRQIAEETRSAGARRALELADNPSAFLSIVQIGVTLNSILTGAFSGEAFAEPLGTLLNAYEPLAPHGESLAFGVTVVGVSYFSLIIGELVPKRIGMSYAESIAVNVAGFMVFLSRLAAPIVWILRFSTDVALRLLRLDSPAATPVTEEEVKEMIAEGAQSGVFEPAEKDMIEGVMRLADRSVRTIMTPRIDVVWLSLEDGREENIRIIRDSGYSRFPVAKGDMEAVLGIVCAKDLLNAAMRGEQLDLQMAMRPALVVPDTTPVLRLLDQMKKAGQDIAIVVDEYGSVEGLVTLADVMEAVIGVLPDEGQDKGDEPVRRADGSWLVDGMTPIDEVETLLGVKAMQDGGEYHTLAGFVIDRLGHLPVAGDVLEWEGLRFEIVDMDARRVDKILIHSLPSRDEADDIEID